MGLSLLLVFYNHHNMKKLVSLLLLFVPLLVVGQEKEMSIRWHLNGRVRSLCEYFTSIQFSDTLAAVDNSIEKEKTPFEKVFFDSLGRCVEDQYFPYGKLSSRRIWYDENDRDTLSVHYDGDVPDIEFRTLYDERGNVLRKEKHYLKSEEEKKSLFIYDWKKEYELKDGKVMGWCEYFEEEMVTKVENEYDDQGRLVCELQYYSEGDSWEEKTVYEYDSRGNLIRECKYDEMCGSNSYPTTTYQYDNLNRMIGKQCLWFDDVCKKELDSLTYSYNENGKFKEIIHSSWSFTPWAEEGSGDCRLDYIYVYSYDENGLVTQMLGWHNGELEVVERYFYDEMDNLVRKEHDDLLYPRQNWLIFRKIEYY